MSAAGPYIAALRTGFRRSLADRAEVISRLGFFLLILVVMSALWHAALGNQPSHQLAGYSLPALLWYVLAAQCAINAVRGRTIEELGDEIGSGAITVMMLRPISVVGMRMALDLGEALARIAVVTIGGGALTLLLVGPPPVPTALPLALIAMLLAAFINIAAQHAFGGISFWLMDARSAWLLYQKCCFILGGMLIPLQMLPAVLAHVCEVLPFAAMAYVPGRIASGHAAAVLLLGQGAWLVVMVGVAALVFQRGERHLRVVGG